MCWIKQARATADGVEITFGQGNATVTRGGHAVPDAVHAGPVILVVIGDHVSVSSLHSGCTIDIVMQDGRPGAQVHATAHLPGLPPDSADAFVPAEGTR